MKIKYIRAKNFLSIGEPVEIDFTKYGNIINIRGENRDHGPGASNGAGKSTIIEIIVYTFFGKLIKNLNHTEAVNIKAGGKGLETEVHFEIDGKDYKVIRRRNGGKNEVEYWEDGIDKTATNPETLKEIIKTAKLNYDSFINVVCFGQHNTKQFLACEPKDKRSIAENLLSLDKYVKYCDVAKKKLKVIQQKIDTVSAVYEKSLQSLASYDKQIKQIQKQQNEWKSAQLNTIDRLQSQMLRIKSDMGKLNKGANTFENIAELDAQISDKLHLKGKNAEISLIVKEKIEALTENKQNLMLSVKEIHYTITRHQKDMDDLKQSSNNLLSQSGGKCPVCYGTIDRKNFQDVLKHNNEQIAEYQKEIDGLAESLKKQQALYKKREDDLATLKEKYEEFKAKEILFAKTLRDLEQRKILASAAFREKADSATLLLEQQIANYAEQIEQKRREADPYITILAEAKEEYANIKEKVDEYKADLTILQGQVPYLEFWIKAFGDDGIRSFILVEVIPVLNNRINYWLQFLVDNKITLNFSKELKEKIERNPPDGDPFVYNGMSGGEHQRIDLGIALAFAQVMMLSSGAMPSIICLDEVGTNLDRPGILAVYNTICELARERQVLVTTHDPDLQEMLAGYDTITIVKENGYSRIEQ